MAKRGRPPGKERVLGPYTAGPGRWSEYRSGARSGDGTRGLRYFSSEEEAIAYADEMRASIKHAEVGIETVEHAITRYKAVLTEKGNKKGSIDLTTHRLRLFFQPVLSLRVRHLSEARARKLYDALVGATKENGEPKYSTDTHRNMLGEARSFGAWCMEKQLNSFNPIEEVQGKGRRKAGKEQLRVDEARKWLDKAIELATAGDDGAVAAMMTLLLGLRAHEVVERHVRDVDDNGSWLWIPSSKTEAGKRTLEIPEVLRAPLLALTEGRPGDAWLFPAEGKSGRHWRDWPREQVQRICDLASVPRVSAQGMRGTQASLAREAGASGHVVAATLGHSSERMHEQAYARKDAVETGRQRAALKVLDGGRRGR